MAASFRALAFILSVSTCAASEETCQAGASCATVDHEESAPSMSLLQSGYEMVKKASTPDVSLHSTVEEAHAAHHKTDTLKKAHAVHHKTSKKQLQAASTAPTEGLPDTVVPQMFDDLTMPAVSTTNKCIMNLALQYFGIYTALALVRTLNSFKFELVGVQKILETGCTTVTYAPMLCILFLGTRMRALQLSQNDTEKWSLPQAFVQDAMQFASYAVLGQLVLVLLIGFMSGTSEVTTDAEGNLDTSKMAEGSPMTVMVLTILRYVIMLALYGGFTTVVYGVFTMEGPAELWPDGQPAVSPSVQCTIILGSLFFVIYLIVAVTKTLFEVAPSLRSASWLTMLEACATSAKMTINFAPMICTLFIGARMRALQIDPVNGSPQPWAQKCFYLCTCSIITQAILVFIMPAAAGAEAKRGEIEGDISFTVENKIIGTVMDAVRYLLLFSLYGGIAAVIASILLIQAEDPLLTPAVSPYLKCIIILTVQYFVIYTMLFVCQTIKSYVKDQNSSLFKSLASAIASFDAGRNTVMFAPMLAALFMGCRMRAEQLATDANGHVPVDAGPQPWAQTAMYISTLTVFIQLVMTILVPLLTGSDKPETDQDGNVKVPAGTNQYLAIFVELVRYVSLIGMYVGATTVAVAIFLMTPSTVQPYCCLES